MEPMTKANSRLDARQYRSKSRWRLNGYIFKIGSKGVRWHGMQRRAVDMRKVKLTARRSQGLEPGVHAFKLFKEKVKRKYLSYSISEIRVYMFC